MTCPVLKRVVVVSLVSDIISPGLCKSLDPSFNLKKNMTNKLPATECTPISGRLAGKTSLSTDRIITLLSLNNRQDKKIAGDRE